MVINMDNQYEYKESDKIIGLSSIIKTAHKLGLVDKLSNDYSIILGTSKQHFWI